MSNTLANTSSNPGRLSRERALAWEVRDILGIDPFHNLRTSLGFDYDVRRTDVGYEVEVPIPGFGASEVEISLKDDLLTIAGKTDRRSISRSFAIPEDIDVDCIDATVKDGILVMKMPRRPEKQPKRILVK